MLGSLDFHNYMYTFFIQAQIELHMPYNGQLEMRSDQRVAQRQVPMDMLARQTFEGAGQVRVQVRTLVMVEVIFIACQVL